MSENVQKVCYWLDEAEEDDLLGNSDDTDADSDYVCPNIHDNNDSESDTDVDISVNPSSSSTIIL